MLIHISFFLHLVDVEKDGIVVPKKKFSLQKNSLISKWTQINDILSVMGYHGFENNDYLKNVLESFDSMIDLHDSPYFQFLRAQLQLLLCSPNARRFDKQILILAAELYSISSAAYKMLRRSGALALPCVTTMKKLLSRRFPGRKLTYSFSGAETSATFS